MISSPLLTLDDVSRITPLRTTVIGLINECSQPEPKIYKVVKLIESDPIFAGRILGMANSPLFGCTREINSIERAIVILGLKTISELAIVAGTEQTVNSSKGNEQMKETLFNHLLGCGIVARLLAMDNPTIEPGEAFLTGILHDVGKLLLLSADVDVQYALISRETDEKQLECERKYYGVQHQELGKRYAELMGLPDRVANAIAAHHKPTEQADLQSTVFHANRLSRSWEIGATTTADNDVENEIPESHELDSLRENAQNEYSHLLDAIGKN